MQLLDRRRDFRERKGEEFASVQPLLKETGALVNVAREQINTQRTGG